MSVDDNKKLDLLHDELNWLRKKKKSLIIITPSLPIMFQVLVLATNNSKDNFDILYYLYQQLASKTNYPIEVLALIAFILGLISIPYFLYKIKYIEKEIEQLESNINSICKRNVIMLQHRLNVNLSPWKSSIFRKRCFSIAFFLLYVILIFSIIDVERTCFWFISALLSSSFCAYIGYVAENRAEKDYDLSVKESHDYYRM